jgi:hypothetical protein
LAQLGRIDRAAASKANGAGRNGRIAFPAVLGIELLIVAQVQHQGRLADEVV